MERPNGNNEQQICHEHNIYGQNSFQENARALYLAYHRGRKDVLKELSSRVYKVSFQKFDCDTIKLTAKDLHDDTAKDRV